MAVKLDRIYDEVDGLLLAQAFAMVDSKLQQLRINELSMTEMIGYLTITLPAAHKLPSREEFYNKVRRAAIFRGHMRPGLMDGLEGPQCAG